MAKFDGKFLTGVIGPAVYKRRGNTQLVTAKSRLNKAGQTENTKKAAAHFGVSSSLAADLRRNLKNIVTDFYDGTMIYRFKTVVQQAMRTVLDQQSGGYDFTSNSFDKLNGFEFNADSPVSNNFFMQPAQTINGNILTISLPEIHVSEDMKFPRKASECLLNIAVGMYDLTYGHKTICPVQTIEITNNDVIPAQELTFEVEPGCLCVSVFSFQFIQKTFSGNQIMNSKGFNPVAVFRAVIAGGVVEKQRTKNWQEITFKNDKEVNEIVSQKVISSKKVSGGTLPGVFIEHGGVAQVEPIGFKVLGKPRNDST